MIETVLQREEIDQRNNEAWQINRSDPQKCRKLALENIGHSERLNYPEGRMYALSALGACQVWLSNYDEALTNLYEARKLLKSKGDKQKEAQVVYHIFCSFYFLADYDNAIEYANQIVGLAEENNDLNAKANALNGLGTIHYTIGDNQKAFDYLIEGLSIAEKLEDKHLLARILDGLGTALFQNNRLNEALVYKERSLEAARESKNRNVESYALTGLAAIHEALKNFSAAEKYYQLSIAGRKEINFKPGVAESAGALGKMYLSSGKHEEAFRLLQEALAVAREIDSNEYLYKIHESLANYYELKNDFGAFKNHYDLSFRHKEIYSSEKNRQKLKSAEMQMKMAQVEKEKELLEKKHRELENYSRDLELLSNLGKKITSQINVESINKTVYEILNTIMDVGGFGIGVADETKNYIEFPGYIEEGEVHESAGYELTDSNRLAVVCYNSDKEILIRDYEKEIEKYVRKGTMPVIGKSVNSIIYLPIKSDRRKIGVLTVQSFEINAYSEYHLNLVRNLAVYCAIALENATSYEKLEEIVEERTSEVKQSYETTKRLNDLGRKITSITKLEEISQTLYDEVKQMMDADSFGIRLFVPEKNQVEYRFQIEKGELIRDVFTVPMSNDNNYSVWCIKNRQSIFTNDNIKDHKKWVKEIHVVMGEMTLSNLYQPMMIGDKILGVITVQSFKRDAYLPHHLDILKTLANYTAIALENANSIELLEQRVKERTDEIVKQKEQIEIAAKTTKTISEVGKEIAKSLSVDEIISTVYKHINRMMDADAFGIGIYREEHQDLFHTGVMEKGKKLPDFSFPLNEERIASICFHEGKEIVINNWEKEYKKFVKKEYVAKAGDAPVSMIYMPLFSGTKKTGAMSVQSFKTNAYNEYHLDILRSLAVYIGSALENASLYKNMEDRVKVRTAEIEKAYENTKLLGQISKDISSSLSVETIIEKVYHSVNKLMDATGFGIGIYHPETEKIRMPGYIEKGEKLEDFYYDLKDDRLATWCFKNKREIFINDYTVEYTKYIKGMKAPVAGKDSASIIYLPLFLKDDEVMGILTIQSFEKNVYTEYHMDILRSLATTIASALENARLYETMEEEVKERTAEVVKQKEQLEKTFANTKLFSEIGKEISSMLSVEDINTKLYNSVNSMVDATIFGVAVFRKEENDLFFSGAMEKSQRLPDFSYPLTENKIATICFHQKKEILINDWENEYSQYVKTDYEATEGEMPLAMIYLPLYSKNQVIGVITVQSFQKNAYKRYHMDILRSLSVYVGSALENANLYQNLEEKVKERTAEIEKAYQDTKLLGQISKEISSSLSIETIVESVYTHVNALMDAASFGIGVYQPQTHTISFPGFIEKNEKINVEFNVDDDRLASWCFKNEKEIVTGDYTVDYHKYVKGIKAVVAGKHSRSIIYIPLFNKEKIIGVLTIQSYEVHAYSEYHLDILRSLANSISIAIDNATLYSNLEDKVRERTAEVVKQKEIIEEKNKHITDSIIYAKRIQEAILPPEETFFTYLKNSFVLYKPKDIVSGDFYWIERKGGKVLFAVVDCTGHGVPGAFMSIIGYNGLNQIVNEYNITQPAEILNRLNKIISQTLKQRADESKIRDGMDISVCCIDFENNKLEFAGANNPIFIVRNKEVIEVKADKHPIGNFVGEEEFRFSNNELDLFAEDRLYLFSDGYADQFGGPRGKKLKYNQFRDLLLEHHQKSMRAQKELLDFMFEEWRGDLEQIDDVCVIGVRVG